MANSTLPIWVGVLIFGVVAMFLVGYANIYVPREQKVKAERIKYGESETNERKTIFCSFRMSRVCCIVFPALVNLIASVLFFIDDFKVLVGSMIGNVVVKNILAIVIYLVVLLTVQIVLTFVLFLGETTSFYEMESYYLVRYGVKLTEKEY